MAHVTAEHLPREHTAWRRRVLGACIAGHNRKLDDLTTISAEDVRASRVFNQDAAQF